MRIAVIGAGSMGSVLGGKLKRAGNDVILFDRDKRHIAAVVRNGLTITDPTGDFAVAIAATTRIGDLSGVNLALVLVDGNATAAVAPLLPAILAESGIALTLQNGIGNVEALAAGLGPSRVLAGATFVSAAMLAPGHAHNTNIGETVLGETSGLQSSRAEAIASLLSSAGFPTRAVANVMGHVWSKFALNCALNPLSAVTGLRPGEVVGLAWTSQLLDEVIAEILGVVGAKGIRLPEADPARHIREHAFLRYNKPSMLQHVEAGRRTEIAGLNEALLGEARALGVPVPVNTAITALVKGIEARNARGSARLDEAGLEAAARASLGRPGASQRIISGLPQ